MHTGLHEKWEQPFPYPLITLFSTKLFKKQKMKKNIFYLVAISAMLISSCRKIEMDGEKEVIIVNGGAGSTTGQTITVSGRINADTTFRKVNTYILKGLVYIVGNHTLTIEPGTVIRGAFSGTDVAALIITRGSKIMATGTETEPSYLHLLHQILKQVIGLELLF